MKKSEKTRSFIIEKTAVLFLSKGYAGTSMSDMERATGLTKGSIYGNFKNKDEVAVEAFKYNYRNLTSALVSYVDRHENSIEKLKAFTEFYRNHFNKGNLKYGCVVANTATEADDTHPKLRAKVNSSIKSWHRYLIDIILKGIEDGSIKANVNAEKYAVLIINLIEGGIIISKSTADKTFIELSLEHIDHLILNELKK